MSFWSGEIFKPPGKAQLMSDPCAICKSILSPENTTTFNAFVVFYVMLKKPQNKCGHSVPLQFRHNELESLLKSVLIQGWRVRKGIAFYDSHIHASQPSLSFLTCKTKCRSSVPQSYPRVKPNFKKSNAYRNLQAYFIEKKKTLNFTFANSGTACYQLDML